MVFKNGHTVYGGIETRFKKKHISWNKSIKVDRKIFPNMGHFNKHSEESKQKNREKHLGKQSWNKGIPHTEEHKQKLKNSWDYNKHITDISRENYSKAKKGIKLSLEHINKLKESRKNWKVPFNDTSIELKIQSFLSLLHLEYFSHKYISEITHSYQCDIFIPEQTQIYENGEIIEIKQKTIIECDGCYFHGCLICNKNKGKELNQFQLEHIERDKIRTKELQEKGFRVIRLWEHEIIPMELNEFKNNIK
jgi:hypothetical protein